MHIRRFALSAGAALGAALAVGAGFSAALACTSLATLNISQPTGAPGTNLTITGSSFSTLSSGASAVSIRWNGVDGPVLAQVAPDASGSISAGVAVPQNVEPGYYVITATQTDKTGAPAFGTPARMAFLVTGNGSGAGAQQGAGQAAAAPPSPGGLGIGAGTVGLLALLGVFGLALFVLGAASFIGTYRRAPAAAPVRRER